jgi:hypothetical protein
MPRTKSAGNAGRRAEFLRDAVADHIHHGNITLPKCGALSGHHLLLAPKIHIGGIGREDDHRTVFPEIYGSVAAATELPATAHADRAANARAVALETMMRPPLRSI